VEEPHKRIEERNRMKQGKRGSKSGERKKPARKHYAIESKSLDHILAVRSDRMSITEQGVRMLCKDGSNSVTRSYRSVRSSRYLRPLSQNSSDAFLQAAVYVQPNQEAFHAMRSIIFSMVDNMV
jgi:hypothetical protein